MTETPNAGLTLLWFTLTWLAAWTGCQASDNPGPTRTPVVVFAASSLMEAFETLEADFERAHPDIDVQLTFAGSQTLRLQIEHGAAADVFASANEAHMRALIDQAVVERAHPLATNKLTIIVPLNNPARVERFEHLARASKLVVGAPQVPLGAYTEQLFAAARATQGPSFVDQVRQHVVSQELNARLVRAKVALGEADAAIVYHTDAVASDQVKAVAVPEALNPRARYVLGITASAPHHEAATLFVAYAGSTPGRHTLQQHGFIADAPSSPRRTDGNPKLDVAPRTEPTSVGTVPRRELPRGDPRDH